jgi:uncharacterized pyridoxamine 5'-phosphate oxidase family protein
MKPIPEPIDPRRVRELALAVIAADPFPHLATIDGDQPRVRPVSPVRTEEFTVYVANLRLYHKTIEIAANPHVELCYLDERHNQVRISGVAEVLTNPALIRDIHQSHNLLRQFMPDPFDPNLIIYQISPRQVRYMQEWALTYYEVAI